MTNQSFLLRNLANTARVANLLVDSFLSSSFDDLQKSGLLPNCVIGFSGGLGSGKTTLIRNIIQSFGINGTIKSPTYTLVESYQLNLAKTSILEKNKLVHDVIFDIHHFDLYRFNEPQEWITSGFDEYFIENALCLIEWPSNAEGMIPRMDLNVDLLWVDNHINCTIIPRSDFGKILLNQVLIRK